jgi:hypothetical protein
MKYYAPPGKIALFKVQQVFHASRYEALMPRAVALRY